MCRRHEARKIDFCELPLDKFACLQAFSHGRLDGRGFSEERAVGGGEKTKGAGAASEKSREKPPVPHSSGRRGSAGQHAHELKNP